jgi:hypothetical protein
LEAILPHIEKQAQIQFRHYRRDPEKLEEMTQQAVANAWRSYLTVIDSGRNPDAFPTVFAKYVCQGVRNGRQIQGMEKLRSVTSPLLQRREGFRVESLPASTATSVDQLYGEPGGQRCHDALEERLRDNTITPPPEQAAFRNDYPAWLTRLGHPKRDITEALANGETTQTVAQAFGKSEGRISQLRGELHADWRQFHGEDRER